MSKKKQKIKYSILSPVRMGPECGDIFFEDTGKMRKQTETTLLESCVPFCFVLFMDSCYLFLPNLYYCIRHLHLPQKSREQIDYFTTMDNNYIIWVWFQSLQMNLLIINIFSPLLFLLPVPLADWVTNRRIMHKHGNEL